METTNYVRDELTSWRVNRFGSPMPIEHRKGLAPYVVDFCRLVDCKSSPLYSHGIRIGDEIYAKPFRTTPAGSPATSAAAAIA